MKPHTTTVSVAEILFDDRSFDFHLSPGGAELAWSIQRIGQVHPVVLRKESRGYTILDGFRRIVILRETGIGEASAVVYDGAACSAAQAAQIALAQFSSGTQPGLADIANIIRKLHEDLHFERDAIVQDVLPILGPDAQPGLFDDFLQIGRLPSPLLRWMSDKNTTHRQAVPLLALSDGARAEFAALVVRLQPGGGKMREAAVLLHEIARREDRDAGPLLQDITQSLDAGRTASQQWDQFMQVLQRRRMPEWDMQERHIRNLIRGLKLPPSVSLEYPPYMEGPDLEMVIRFRTRAELINAVDALRPISVLNDIDMLAQMI